MNLLKKLECKKLQKSPPKPNSKETHAQRLVSWAWTQLKSLVARTAVWGLINCYDCKVCKCWWLWNSCCEPPNLPVSAYLCLSSVSKGFFSENMPVLKLVFQLSLTWFLSCFKKTLLQCVFSSHLFSQRHQNTEVGGLTCMHHVHRSVVWTEGQEMEGTLPTASVLCERACVAALCCTSAGTVCAFRDMSRHAHRVSQMISYTG